MDSKKHFRHLVGVFAAILLSTASWGSSAQSIETAAAEAVIEKDLVTGNCSQLYASVEERPFTVPHGSWFWKEARNYLAGMGLPHDSHHIKMFEEAFESVYSKFDSGNIDHSAVYEMSPIFQKAGLGDVAFDYCSSSWAVTL
jgi:hypothetical protein